MFEVYAEWPYEDSWTIDSFETLEEARAFAKEVLENGYEGMSFKNAALGIFVEYDL